MSAINWLRVLDSAPGSGPRQRLTGRRLSLEPLEDRTVPSVTAASESLVTAPNTATTIDVLSQSNGESTEPISLSAVGPVSPSGPTLTQNANGTLTFKSSTTGTYTFNYSVAGTQQDISTSGEDDDEFGNSVAVSGDIVAIGAQDQQVGSNRQGAVFVFTLGSSGWSLQQDLTASDGAAGDNFGWSVALDGTTLVVGAAAHTVGSNADQGAAYVFTQSDSTWTQQQELTASDGGANDFFGDSVGISGNTIVVGADEHVVNNNLYQGAAYVFTRSGSTWSQQQELTASDGAEFDSFGYSVGISGNTIVVGSRYAKIGTDAEQGAAYVFTQSGSTWSQQQKLTASDGATDDFFGTSAAISGTTIVVGANQHAVGNNADQGAAYVFTQSGSTWSQAQELTANDGAASDFLGGSVSISGTTIVVGASAHQVGSNADQGAAYVFSSNGTTWSQQQELTASNGTASSYFGSAVAIDAGRVVVGADKTTVSNNTDQGEAYIQDVPQATATVTVTVNAPQTVGVFNPATATWYLNGSNTSGSPTDGQFTYGGVGWIALVGDFTGDGQTTVVVVNPSTETWYIRTSNGAGGPSIAPFQYGAPGWIPVVGDWNGSGKDGIGVVDPTTGTWYLRNEVSAGSPDAGTFAYGAPGWIPVVGNWTGNTDGQDGIGMVDPTTETWYLRNTATAGGVSYAPFTFGAPGWTPVVGAWTDSATTGIGVYDGTGTFYLRNELSSGGADAGQFAYGAGGWTPLAGQWENLSDSAQDQLAAGIGPGAPAISNAVLQSTVQEALALLKTNGINPVLLQQLASANYLLAALPPGVLGETFVQSNTVEISADAAGYGWYVDTSADDPAFTADGSVAPGSLAAGHEDLLTTVLHEMGHLAGQADVANTTTGSALMDAVLPLGTRRIDALDLVFANGTFI